MAATCPAVYPDGFLPNILTTVTRRLAGASATATAWARDWNMDASVNHGRSELAFHERNSINVSYWYEPKCSCSIYDESPTEADTGTLRFTQTTVNPDLRGPLTLGGTALQLAAGLEYRRDGYQIVAGDPVSYQYGRTNNPAIVILDQTGGIAAAGIQGFPGYTPATAVDDGAPQQRASTSTPSTTSAAAHAGRPPCATSAIPTSAAPPPASWRCATTRAAQLGLRASAVDRLPRAQRAAEVLQLGLDQPERAPAC